MLCVALLWARRAPSVRSSLKGARLCPPLSLGQELTIWLQQLNVYVQIYSPARS